jgi:uncharacterized protein (DUF927 family)
MSESETVFVDVESFRVAVEVDAKGKVEKVECSCDSPEITDVVEDHARFNNVLLTSICEHQKAALSEVYSQYTHDFDVEVHY